MIAPVIGWYWAKRICERTARDLREPLGGPGRAAPGWARRSPRRCRATPTRPRAEPLRQSLAKLTAEQNSNVVFYAGPKGILGMGSRWGSWQMAEELVPARGPQGDQPVPQLGRHPGDPRPAADAGARPAAHRRLPQAVDTALGRGARRRGRRQDRPAHRHRGRRVHRQGLRDPADLQQPAVRQGQPALPGHPVHAVGRQPRHHADGHGHRARAHPAGRGDRPRPRPDQRPVHLGAEPEDQDGQQVGQVLGDQDGARCR